MRSSSLISAILFAVIILVVFFLYFPGLSGEYYIFDDAHVVRDNRYIRIAELGLAHLMAAANSFAAGGRELAMLTFALNLYFFPDSVWWLKCVNVLIHLANGLGVFLLLRVLVDNSNPLTGRGLLLTAWIPFFPVMVAAIWLVQPINLTSVLYVSQRMTLLSGFFVIYGLLVYVLVRISVPSGSRQVFNLVAALACFSYLGYLCKENAVLLPVFAMALEMTVFRFRNGDGRPDPGVIGLFIIGLLAVLAALIVKFYTDPDWISRGYRTRLFTLEERVLTQFRALVFYIYQIIAPSNDALSLWHDDFPLSRGILTPVTTAWSLLLLVFLAATALWMQYRKMLPLFVLGIFWFFIAHSIESTVISLEIMHEHRNYLASFGIWLAIIALATRFLGSRPAILGLLVCAIFLIHGAVLYQRAYIWADDERHAHHEADIRPDSGAAAFNLAQKYYVKAMNGVEGMEEIAVPLIKKAWENDPVNIAPELLLAVISTNPNVAYQSQWLSSARTKLEDYPYSATNRSALQKFYQCIKDQKCRLPREDVQQLFETALASPSKSLNTTAAFYFLEIEQDNEKAELGFEKALSRDTQTWINYIQFLLHTKKLTEACAAYEKLQDRVEGGKQEDDFDFYYSTIRYHPDLQDCSSVKS